MHVTNVLLSVVAVAALFLLESETAPLAGRGSVLIAAVELDVLHGVTKAELIHTGASGGVTVDLNDGKGIDELLGVASVGLQ